VVDHAAVTTVSTSASTFPLCKYISAINLEGWLRDENALSARGQQKFFIEPLRNSEGKGECPETAEQTLSRGGRIGE